MKKIWPFSFYFLIYAGIAAYLPYRILYYQSLSFTGVQIGLLAGIAPLITMVSLPLVTGLADRTSKHRLIMSLSLMVVITELLIFPYLQTFLPLLGLTILFSVFFSPVLSLADSAAMFMLGDSKELYGRIRLGGTLGFGLVATLAGALVENYGLKIAFWGAGGLFLATFVVGQKLVHSGEGSQQAAEKERPSALLKNPHFMLFLLISLAGGISFATINTYLFPYMKELGARESIMGLALTIGTISEIPLLFFANRFIKRFEAYELLIFSLALTGLRFLLLAVAPSPIFVLFLQLLNGFNYPLLTVAGVSYADACAPKGFRATAQGLFRTAMTGIGSAAGSFAGGLLFERFGAKGMYLVFALFVALVLAVVSLARRMLPLEQERAPQ